MANEKGTYLNPYSYEEYLSAFTGGHWNGGYVILGAVVYYYSPNGTCYATEEEAYGCGCGSGSGEGSGPIYGNGNILAGSDHIFMPYIEFDFSWDEGTAKNGVEVHIGIKMYDISIDSVSVGWEWKGNYTIQFSVSYRYVSDNTGNTMTCNYIIPEFYRV